MDPQKVVKSSTTFTIGSKTSSPSLAKSWRSSGTPSKTLPETHQSPIKALRSPLWHQQRLWKFTVLLMMSSRTHRKSPCWTVCFLLFSTHLDIGWKSESLFELCDLTEPWEASQTFCCFCSLFLFLLRGHGLSEPKEDPITFVCRSRPVCLKLVFLLKSNFSRGSWTLLCWH